MSIDKDTRTVRPGYDDAPPWENLGAVGYSLVPEGRARTSGGYPISIAINGNTSALVTVTGPGFQMTSEPVESIQIVKGTARDTWRLSIVRNVAEGRRPNPVTDREGYTISRAPEPRLLFDLDSMSEHGLSQFMHMGNGGIGNYFISADQNLPEGSILIGGGFDNYGIVSGPSMLISGVTNVQLIFKMEAADSSHWPTGKVRAFVDLCTHPVPGNANGYAFENIGAGTVNDFGGTSAAPVKQLNGAGYLNQVRTGVIHLGAGGLVESQLSRATPMFAPYFKFRLTVEGSPLNAYKLENGFFQMRVTAFAW